MNEFFAKLEEIHRKPELFESYTAADLWTDEHIAKRMLTYHLDPGIDVSSRREAFIERSVAWIVSRFGVGRHTRIADFGCGPGLYTRRLAERGAIVTGIDFSSNSIEHARGVAERAGLPIEYIVQNYLEFETPARFDLILMIMCDFCVLGPAQRRGLLRRFRSLLDRGGAVLLDVYSLNAFRERREANSCEANLMDGFWSAQPYYGFLNTFRYAEAKVVLDKYTIVEAARTRTIYSWLQYFTPETLWREFEDAGFVEKEFYADVAGAPFDAKTAEFAIVAQRG